MELEKIAIEGFLKHMTDVQVMELPISVEEKAYKVDPLPQKQLDRLEWLLKDWSANIKYKDIVIPDILEKMRKGVQ